MVALWQTLRTRHHCGRGLLVLILTLLFLSLLAGANLTPESRVYVAGQVADSDVIADRDILWKTCRPARPGSARCSCSSPRSTT